jgi:hypothetical protein
VHAERAQAGIFVQQLIRESTGQEPYTAIFFEGRGPARRALRSIAARHFVKID